MNLAPKGRGEGLGGRDEKARCKAAKAPLEERSPKARGCSSDGRALQSHCRGQGFDSPQLHQPYFDASSASMTVCCTPVDDGSTLAWVTRTVVPGVITERMFFTNSGGSRICSTR